MHRISHLIVKYHKILLVFFILLLIPSVLGMLQTRINYDMLVYLPEDLETVQGQDILLKDFGKGAFSILIVEDMDTRQIARLTEDIRTIDHVDTALSYADLTGGNIPEAFLPDEYRQMLSSGNAELIAVFFDSSTSSDETMQAIDTLRETVGAHCSITGMSALVTELKALCEREEPVYVGLAVLFATAAMMLFMDSWTVPLVFLASIGMAVLYNLGTNYFLGEISYITKALSAVLQLAVTMDYSIFLWHSYSENRRRMADRYQAMECAITQTFSSVLGSSITTIAGFLAMCFMSFTLGRDLGFVMAKGVVFGVIGCVTILPAMILVLDKLLEKTRHRPLLPNLAPLARFTTKRYWVFLLLFAILLVPSFYGYQHSNVYYDMIQSLPEDMDIVVANTRLRESFDMASTHMILVDESLGAKQTKQMMAEIDAVDGVKKTLGVQSLVGSSVPAEFLPERLQNALSSGGRQLLLVSSAYSVASDEANAQVETIDQILKRYDPQGMLIGEAPCTRDMIRITAHDFDVVDAISIAAIFLIILLVFRSISLPVVLVAVIELAIFINLGIPYYTNTRLPFIAPICISTIQLGATVDYAILMTTRYKKERREGVEKRQAVTTALSSSIPSIIVSAIGFFAATFGVAMYSDIDIISSMCLLMARGALISMLCVIFLLPAMLMLFDRLIGVTTLGFRKQDKKQVEVIK